MRIRHGFLMAGLALVAVGFFSATHPPEAAGTPEVSVEAPIDAPPVAGEPSEAADTPPSAVPPSATTTTSLPAEAASSASRNPLPPVGNDASRQALLAGLGAEPEPTPVPTLAPGAPEPPSAPLKAASPKPEPKPEPKAEARPEPKPEPKAAPEPSAGAAPEPVRTRPLRILADVIGAAVRIDGSAAGNTPLPARNLSYGVHEVEVEVGGVVARRSFTVDANLSTTLRYLSKDKRWVWE